MNSMTFRRPNEGNTLVLIFFNEILLFFVLPLNAPSKQHTTFPFKIIVHKKSTIYKGT